MHEITEFRGVTSRRLRQIVRFINKFIRRCSAVPRARTSTDAAYQLLCVPRSAYRAHALDWRFDFTMRDLTRLSSASRRLSAAMLLSLIGVSTLSAQQAAPTNTAEASAQTGTQSAPAQQASPQAVIPVARPVAPSPLGPSGQLT